MLAEVGCSSVNVLQIGTFVSHLQPVRPRRLSALPLD
jgi:hypothetical protein